MGLAAPLVSFEVFEGPLSRAPSVVHSTASIAVVGVAAVVGADDTHCATPHNGQISWRNTLAPPSYWVGRACPKG